MVELDGHHLPALVERFQPQVMAFVRRLLTAPDRLQVSPLKAFRVFLGLLLAYELTDRLAETALGEQGGGPGNLEDFIEVYLYGILKPEQGGDQQDEHE
jgi:hypothetical protein